MYYTRVCCFAVEFRVYFMYDAKEFFVLVSYFVTDDTDRFRVVCVTCYTAFVEKVCA